MKPCKLDHNGECLVCDAWPSNCAYDRLMNRDYQYESYQELVDMLDEYLTEEEKNHAASESGPEFASFFENPSDEYWKQLHGLDSCEIEDMKHMLYRPKEKP